MRQPHKRIDMTGPNALNKGKKQPKKSKKVPATAFRVTFRAFFIEYVSNYCTSSYPSKEWSEEGNKSMMPEEVRPNKIKTDFKNIE